MVHTVHNFLVFVRQGMPKVEPLRLLNLGRGRGRGPALFRSPTPPWRGWRLDNLDEVP